MKKWISPLLVLVLCLACAATQAPPALKSVPPAAKALVPPERVRQEVQIKRNTKLFTDEAYAKAVKRLQVLNNERNLLIQRLRSVDAERNMILSALLLEDRWTTSSTTNTRSP